MSAQRAGTRLEVIGKIPPSPSPIATSLKELELRQAIVAEARTWLKTPYHHQGRVKGAGVDCAQFLYAVFVEGTGVVPPFEIPGYSPQYGLHRDDEVYLGWIGMFGRPVKDGKPGDLVTYQFGRVTSHAVIVLEWPQIIHATKAGCILDTVETPDLADHQQAIYRLNQFAD
jgi:cell wall-associated NlpC family hydrolase